MPRKKSSSEDVEVSADVVESDKVDDLDDELEDEFDEGALGDEEVDLDDLDDEDPEFAEVDFEDDDLDDVLEDDDELEVASIDDIDLDLDGKLVEVDRTERPVADVISEDEDEDEDEEDDDDEDDVEASLDEILRERLVVVEDDDDEVDDEKADITGRVLPRQPDEFVCQSCFLVKSHTQLANKEKEFCRDCV